MKAEYVHTDTDVFVDFKMEIQGSYLIDSIESQLSEVWGLVLKFTNESCRRVKEMDTKET